jgi:hypothetical protein
VQFYPHGDRTLSPIPASIKHIYRDKKTYLAVQRQLPAGNTVVDPFALYPYFPAKLYSSQLSPTLELVQLDWIFSHYARWNFSPRVPRDQYTAHRVGGGGSPKGLPKFLRSKYYCKMCLGNSLDVLHKSHQSLLGLHLPDCVNNMLQLATCCQMHHISP